VLLDSVLHINVQMAVRTILIDFNDKNNV
jgi:hypothetical protein